MTINYEFDAISAPSDYNEKLISKKLLDLDASGDIKLCQILTVEKGVEADMNIPGELEIEIEGKKEKLVIVSVKTGAFEESNARSVILPSTITQIKKNAFLNCGKLQKATLNFDIPLKSEAGKDISPVIEESAFQGSSKLDTVEINGTDANSNKNAIITFGNNTFVNCSALQNVDISTTAKMKFGNSTFKNCTSMVKFVFPDNINTIGTGTFENCSKLESVKLSSTYVTTNLLPTQFNKCLSLKEFLPYNEEGGNENSTYTVKDGCLYKYNKADNSLTELVMYPPNKAGDVYNVPETVKKIYDYAFGYNCDETASPKAYYGANQNLVTLNITNSSAVEIGTRALVKAKKLKTVKFYGINSKIGESCFEGCPYLESYSYKNTSAEINSAIINKNAFKDCVALKEVELINWKEVGISAFQGCTAMKKLRIGNIVKIGNYAFEGCTDLNELIVDEGIATIGDYVFKNCESLIDVDLSKYGYHDYANNGTFGVYNFENCINLQSVIMPDGLTGISTGTFKNCVNLSKVKRSDKKLFFGTYIYDQSTGLRTAKEYLAGDAMGEIANEAFYNCGNLKEIYVPRFLVIIGKNAFYNCTSLDELTFTRSVLEECISKDAFNQCSKDLKINAPIDSGMYNFAKENSMSVGTVADDMIDDEFVIYNDEDETGIDNVAIGYIGGFKELTIRVPSSGVFRIDGHSTTSKGTSWIDCPMTKNANMKKYLQKLTLRNISVGSNASDGKNQFSGSSALTDVVFENNTDTTTTNNIDVCEGAFQNCAKLDNLIFCNNIPVLGKNAFSGCSALERVELPRDCKTIGETCFAKNIALNKLKLNNKLSDIGKQAFLNCTSLTTVTIPGNVAVGENAFKGCNLIERVIVPSNVSMPTSIDAFINGMTGEKALKIVTNEESKIVGYAAGKGFDVEYVSFVNGVNAVDIVVKGQVIDTEKKIVSMTKNGNAFNNIKNTEPEATVDSYDSKEFTAYNYIVGDDEDYVVEGDVLEMKLDPSLGFVPYVIINEKNVVDVVDGVATYTVGENEHINVKVAYGDYHYIKIPANVVVKRGNDYLTNNAIINANDLLKISVEPENGYEAKKVTLNDKDITSEIGKGYSYVVKEGENVILTAEFVKKEYHITIPNNVFVTKNGEFVINGATVNAGDELYIYAVAPDAGYELNKLTVNGNEISNKSTYKVKANENVIITVRFIQPGETGGYNYGDVNADGKITKADAELLIKKVRNDNITIAIQQKIGDNYINVVDVDGDNKITASDVAEILLKSANENYVFKVENN